MPSLTSPDEEAAATGPDGLQSPDRAFTAPSLRANPSQKTSQSTTKGYHEGPLEHLKECIKAEIVKGGEKSIDDSFYVRIQAVHVERALKSSSICYRSSLERTTLETPSTFPRYANGPLHFACARIYVSVVSLVLPVVDSRLMVEL